MENGVRKHSFDVQESYKNINTTATAANEIDDCSAHSLFSSNLSHSSSVCTQHKLKQEKKIMQTACFSSRSMPMMAKVAGETESHKKDSRVQRVSCPNS